MGSGSSGRSEGSGMEARGGGEYEVCWKEGEDKSMFDVTRGNVFSYFPIGKSFS